MRLIFNTQLSITISDTDNMKPIVNKPRTRYFKGEVNSQFEEFSKDFGFKVIPCKAKSPRKISRAFYYT